MKILGLFVLAVFELLFKLFWFGVLFGFGGGGGSKGTFLTGGAKGVNILLIIRVDCVCGIAYFDRFNSFFFN